MNCNRKTPLWRPSDAVVNASNMTAFMKKTGCQTYPDLYTYSIENSEDFWRNLWVFCDVIGELGSKSITNKNHMEKAVFFEDSRLNFAENLLKRRDDAIAIEFYGEDCVRQTLTFHEVYLQTARLSAAFKAWGLQPGDRVAGYLPNLPQTIIAMLAATSLGAVWTSCSPDFGVDGATDRFGQVKPKIFITCDGYYYGGKQFDCAEKNQAILTELESVEKAILVDYIGKSDANYLSWDSIQEDYKTVEALEFQKFPFNHPLYILYSSGTTGMPKCIVHNTGGVLLQHLKEHQLHCDLKPQDKLFYFTTCGWMMWNWLASGLATGASLVLYDGSPVYPKTDSLFDLVEQSGITVFGTSAKYIDNLAKNNCVPLKTHDLSSIRMITSTGSPLAPESFDYVYQDIKKDVCLASISGGTDIVSCFALGNPMAPVWRGELQTPGLAMRVDVFDDEGKSVRNQKGELVCTAPFPCQPIGFWNDPSGEKYHNAYFARFPNVWHHGDFVEITEHGGLIIFGRSDTVLNPGGVRIGTAEIYRQVEQIEEVMESLVVGQNWNNDVRVVLFVRLRQGVDLTLDLQKRICHHIRSKTTPRHVPSKIIEISDIPRTKSGKIAEMAVHNVIHGQEVKNKASLANPEALGLYEHLTQLKD